MLPALGAGLVKIGVNGLSAIELRSLGIKGITNINNILKAESSFIRLENTLTISNRLKKAGVIACSTCTLSKLAYELGIQEKNLANLKKLESIGNNAEVLGK